MYKQDIKLGLCSQDLYAFLPSISTDTENKLRHQNQL